MTTQVISHEAPTAISVAAAARTVGATKVYGKDETEVRALDGITVEFARAQFTAIMGPSGSGKSTLLHCVAGDRTPEPDAGTGLRAPWTGHLHRAARHCQHAGAVHPRAHP